MTWLAFVAGLACGSLLTLAAVAHGCWRLVRLLYGKGQQAAAAEKLRRTWAGVTSPVRES